MKSYPLYTPNGERAMFHHGSLPSQGSSKNYPLHVERDIAGTTRIGGIASLDFGCMCRRTSRPRVQNPTRSKSHRSHQMEVTHDHHR
jgi:hypothetical protein